MSAQRDDRESGCRRDPESLGSDGMGAESQCVEGYGGGSGAAGDCVSAKCFRADQS